MLFFLTNFQGTYPRYSTHFEERLSESFVLNPGTSLFPFYSFAKFLSVIFSTFARFFIVTFLGPQCGLDIRGMGLPAGKNTVLFFRVGDGTTLIKLEGTIFKYL